MNMDENISYLEEVYNRLKCGEPIAQDWQEFFETVFRSPTQTQNSIPQTSTILDSIRALMLIRAFRTDGHLKANLDPLNLDKKKIVESLDPKVYGFEEKDYDRPIFIDGVLGLKNSRLRKIIQILESTYCRNIGIEFMHIEDADQKSWIQNHFENKSIPDNLTSSQKQELLSLLRSSEFFEKFLTLKFVGTKRFGLEGAEGLIPVLETFIRTSFTIGCDDFIIGMAHRGRLNVMSTIFQVPLSFIFSKFQDPEDNLPTEYPQGGDVKYHIGTTAVRTIDSHKIRLSLTANPSHLESIDPVVLGKVRGLQHLDQNNNLRTLGILLHGDAAFAGQGLVAETFELSQLEDYKTNGTLHIIINNQIGFTTNPSQARSSPYCSDVAKIVNAPIFHVNGDDPESLVFVANCAAQFRAKFKKDVVIDLFCYRRFGHNELDEPSYTQPLMYQAIQTHPPVYEIYAQKLIRENILSPTDIENGEKKEHDHLQTVFEDWEMNTIDLQPISNSSPHTKDTIPSTGVSFDVLSKIGDALTRVPEDFSLHPKLQHLMIQRQESLASKKGIDWALAESLAMGSLLLEKTFVRISGQDTRRGTFSQRHAVLIDQKTEKTYTPLNHIVPGQSQEKIEIVDSPLAEASILGFEYGYSLGNPKALVIWEAQFGDFANGAQVIIDQFVVSGTAKWGQYSSLVMLLPHGYEGQGSDHSSGRLERYLQLAADGNIQVANCTTPANYFHILRRQIKNPLKKPLILMTPKSLLRLKDAISDLDDMLPGTTFQPILSDEILSKSPKTLKKIILCTGKIFYDLLEARKTLNLEHQIALIRIEEIYPFPADELQGILAHFPHAQIIWCQEEPKNMGAWTFILPYLESVLRGAKTHQRQPLYVGRPESASPATGYPKRHVQEQKKLVQDALHMNS